MLTARRWRDVAVWRWPLLVVPALAFSLLFPLVGTMPSWDQWSLIPLWRAHFEGGDVLGELFRPYAGHFNFLPKLIFYGLGVVSRWDIRLEVIANFLIAALTLWLLLRLLERHGAGAAPLALSLAAQVFSFTQYENFLSGYPLGQNLEQAAATATIFLLTLPALRWRTVAGAMITAAAATFSWGAGLAVWPVGLLALATHRDRSRPKTAAWTIAALAAFALVRWAASGRFGQVTWAKVPVFLLALLGKPWAPAVFPTSKVAVACGALALTLFGVLALLARRILGSDARPWVLCGTLAIASSTLIATGRANSGIHQALASHYATASYQLLVACAALGFLGARSLGAARPRRRSVCTAAALAIGVAVVAQAVVACWRGYGVISSWAVPSRRHELAIARGTATDAEIRGVTHPDPQLVRSGVEVLRNYGLAWFRDVAAAEPPGGGVLAINGRQPATLGPVPAIGRDAWGLSGWAVRSVRRGGPVKAVYLFLDGRRVAAATLDLAGGGCSRFGCFPGSEWSVGVPAGTVTPGPHALWVASADFQDRLFTLYQADIVGVEGATPSGGPAN